METRTLGASGPALSVLGLGCNNFGMKIDCGQSAAVVHAALDVGITHFDTAEMYGEGQSEAFLGEALAGHRDEVVIATKYLPRMGGSFTAGDLTRRIIESAEQSLCRLRTDRIDLFYQHYPDPDAPVDELLDAFEQLTTAGKVIHTGISNVDAGYLSAVSAATETRPSIRPCGVQVEWSLLSRGVEDDIVPAAAGAGFGVIPYLPLASGMLTGKYRAGQVPDGSRLAMFPMFADIASPENHARVDRLTTVADAHGRSLTELAIGWLLAQSPVASVIAGATSADQVRANAAAAGWELTRAVQAEIEHALAPTSSAAQ